jgi:L-threonylcarbamoyladenylate synthase
VNADPRQIASAAYRLRRGGVVGFPTETVYGLGAVALDPVAVAQVFALKGRPADNPLIVHVSGVAMARAVASDWPTQARILARAFWPGPLSIVVGKAPHIPDNVTAGGPTVCVRCPDHPVARALIEAVDRPLVGPSANRSGGVSPTTADHVRQAFPDLLVVDGGPCRVGIESTVVRLVRGGLEILRPGIIGADDLERATGERVLAPKGGANPAGAPVQSPGLLGRHYAPRTPMRLVEPATPGRVDDAAVLAQAPVPGAGVTVAMPAEASAYAAALYDALRRADTSGRHAIVVVRPAGPGPRAVWDAVADRLERMTAPDRGRT